MRVRRRPRGGADITIQATAVDRFSAPLYTPSEAATYLGLSTTTVRSWTHGYRTRRHGREISGRPVLSAVDAPAGGATIPFVGLAEGYALAAIRRQGVQLQRIRPALERLDTELGLQHALASRRLFTDGSEVLFDYAQHASDEVSEAVRELVVVRDGQRVFTEVVAAHLQRIEFATDGYATAFPLPGFTTARLVADARRAFGYPVFEHGGARLEDALGLFRAGESIAVVSEEYGVPRDDLEDAIRTLLPGGHRQPLRPSA